MRGSTRRRESLGRPPAALLTIAVIAAVALVLPILGLGWRLPWSDLGDLLTDEDTLRAAQLSLITSLVATAFCAVLGLPLAWVLAYVSFPGRRIVRAFVTVPLVLPPVVAGVALLAAFGRRGLVGKPLFDAFGVAIPFTTVAVVIAHVFVALPFFVVSVEGAMRLIPDEYSDVAADLYSSRMATFLHVTLPLALPGIAAGAVLSFARSLGEFGATITFAGNYPRTTQTLPLLTYTELNRDPGAAYALAMAMLVFCLVVLALLRERWIR